MVILKSIYNENLDFNKLYSFNTLTLKNSYIKELLANFKSINLSILLKTTLEYMLNEMTSLRMSSADIIKFISLHEKDLWDPLFDGHEDILRNWEG